MSEGTGGDGAGEPDGVYNPLASADVRTDELPAGGDSPSTASIREDERTDERKPTRPMVEFWMPTALKAYEPPANQQMVGDYHIQRGAISVLAGPPGCGKSRAALFLAILGAKGSGNWFGFKVHTQFRTLILQNENGLTRLHRDFAQLELPSGIDEYLRISAPPTLGLNMANRQFREELKAIVKAFAPHLIVVDPWNALARDAMEKDYQEAFDKLREVMAESPENPACLIVHHLRKPKSEDRQRGRGLTNLLAGSYTIISVPRSVFVLQPASDDVEDNRVVFTPGKNNDGELGSRTAWERSNGMFVPVDGFDFMEFDQGGAKAREAKVKPEHLRELFKGGLWLKRAEATEGLRKLAGAGRTAAYEALSLDGRYADMLAEGEDGKISLRPDSGD